ncbi:MAG: DUF6383 domain-containing protein [Parabacteroides sp.]
MNQTGGNGFTLSAMKDGQKIEVADNPLLDKKLVAVTIDKGSDEITNEAAKKIVGGSTSQSRTYFISTGHKELLKLATEEDQTASKVTFTDSNVNDIVSAFKEATLVAVNKEQVYVDKVSTMPVGLGYNYAIFSGSSLLAANGTEVPVENAMFEVIGAEGDNLTITNPYAKFPKDGYLTDVVADGNLFRSTEESTIKGVRPLIYTNPSNVNILVTAPASGNYIWTQIGFSSSAGSIPSNEFQDKNVSVSIADIEIKKNSDDQVLSTINLEGYKISPNSYADEIKNEADGTTFKEYKNMIVSFCPANYLAAGTPEDAWVLTKENGFFLLKNREKATYISLGETIYQVGEGLYALKTPLTGDYNGEAVKIDTLKITEVELGELDGYAHSQVEGDTFDKSVLATTPYQLGIMNASFNGTIFYATSYNTDELTVASKQEEGLSFILTPCDTVGYGIFQDKDGKKVYDLRRVRYALQDQKSGRYVKYTQGVCVLDPMSYNTQAEALSNATMFYLKEKGADQYELLVSQGYYDPTNNNAWTETGGNLKVYVNSSAQFATLGLYTQATGDKFSLLTKQSALSQDDILNKLVGKSDTTLVRLNFISLENGSSTKPWMLAADENRYLVEGLPISKPDMDITTKAQGGLNYEAVRFSLMLDTAYVQRAGATTPLYYIVMNSEKATEQPTQADGKTSGYYLFAMTDSIYNSQDENWESLYCYHSWGQHNARLRFVKATHEADSIYIASATPSAKDTIQAGSTEGVALIARQKAWLAAQSEGTAGNPQNHTNQGINYGLFAFEANPNAPASSPEYALYNPASKLYVYYWSGNIVMAPYPTYYRLDVSRPSDNHFIVANEEVAAPEPFAVTGGMNQVEIRQAAGKQAKIYNILGKELANRRLRSDREILSLPKGIAIVSVEGETPVKVIVK